MWDELILGLEDLVGFWRYVASPVHRRRKNKAWKRAWPTLKGRVLVVGEIIAATLFGLGLPVLALLLVLWNLT